MLTNYHVLTNSGQNIITRSLVENKSIEFTSYKVGDGDVATIDEIKLLTDIKGDLIKKFGVAKTSKVSNSTTSVSGQYDNSDIVVATQVKEYALFAKLEGESSEVLFSYQGLGDGFILPSYTGTLLTQVVDFTITMTQEVGVVVRFNPSALVDMQTFFEELDKKVDKTSIKTEQLTNTNTDILSSAASRNLFENGAGGKCLGYIEDGGQHTPHETNFWISKKVNGQFRCIVSNSDNYIDADKWLPIDDNSNASKLKNLDRYEKNWKYIFNGTVQQYQTNLAYSILIPKEFLEILFIESGSQNINLGKHYGMCGKSVTSSGGEINLEYDSSDENFWYYHVSVANGVATDNPLQILAR